MAAVRIITLNVNGVRSAAKKGLFEWLQSQRADVICLQETKAQEHQLVDATTSGRSTISCFFCDARRQGLRGNGAVYAPTASPIKRAPRIRQSTSSIARDATSRRSFAITQRRLLVYALRVGRSAPAGFQVSLP
jgi:exonuclease III